MERLHILSKNKVLTTILSAAVIGLGIFGFANVSAGTIQDCKWNSIIKCGEPSASSFISQVRTNSDKNGHHDLQAIYSHFGLEPGDYDKFVTSSRPGMAYQNGTIVVDGQTVATNAWSIGRQHFSYATSYKIGGTTYYKAYDKQVLLQNLPVMVMFNSKGQMQFAVMNACGNPAKGNIVTPKYSCNLLHKSSVNGQANTYDFWTSASASNNAKVTKVVYDFGDGSSTVTESSLSKKVRHTYVKPGTWTARVTVYVSLPGKQTTTVTSANCETQITVAQPFFQCVSLTPYTVDKEKREYRFIVTTKQGNGATLKDASFNFGDNNSTNNVAPSNENTVETDHTYSQDGTFAITATVNFNTPSGVQSDSCVAQIAPSVTPPKPPVVPPSPPVTPPKQLINTGPGSIFGIFTVASIAGGLGYRYLTTRRFSRGL
jgi:PKD domain